MEKKAYIELVQAAWSSYENYYSKAAETIPAVAHTPTLGTAIGQVGHGLRTQPSTHSFAGK